MKTIHYVFIGALFVAMFLVEYDISNRVDSVAKPATNNTQTATESVLPAATELSAIENYTADQANGKFVEKFKSESLEIAKLQKNPEEVQKRLQALANEMTPADVQGLFEIMSDEKKDGDQRALAVELLSLKNDTSSLVALQNFVANSTNINGNKWDRKKELETVLRAQAIESIATYPQKDIAFSTLSYLQNKVDEKFLSDRIGRAATSLIKTQEATIQEQDDEALKELVE